MITRKDHEVMCNFCLFIKEIGLAPHGLNLLKFHYIDAQPKDFIYCFGKKEDFEDQPSQL